MKWIINFVKKQTVHSVCGFLSVNFAFINIAHFGDVLTTASITLPMLIGYWAIKVQLIILLVWILAVTCKKLYRVYSQWRENRKKEEFLSNVQKHESEIRKILGC